MVCVFQKKLNGQTELTKNNIVFGVAPLILFYTERRVGWAGVPAGLLTT